MSSQATPVKFHLKSDLASQATRHDILSSNELSSQAIVDEPPFKETPRTSTGGSETRFLCLILPVFRTTFVYTGIFIYETFRVFFYFAAAVAIIFGEKLT